MNRRDQFSGLAREHNTSLAGEMMFECVGASAELAAHLDELAGVISNALVEDRDGDIRLDRLVQQLDSCGQLAAYIRDLLVEAHDPVAWAEP